MAKQIWRMVGGQTINCTECRQNQKQDGNDICTAEGEVCMFLKQKIDGQKTWEDFRDAYREAAGK